MTNLVLANLLSLDLRLEGTANERRFGCLSNPASSVHNLQGPLIDCHRGTRSHRNWPVGAKLSRNSEYCCVAASTIEPPSSFIVLCGKGRCAGGVLVQHTKGQSLGCGIVIVAR